MNRLAIKMVTLSMIAGKVSKVSQRDLLCCFLKRRQGGGGEAVQEREREREREEEEEKEGLALL